MGRIFGDILVENIEHIENKVEQQELREKKLNLQKKVHEKVYFFKKTKRIDLL